MGGLFGVAAKQECVLDLFYGTDYHSHLGTRRGGMAVLNGDGFTRSIHNIENSPFRTKFEDDLAKFHGSTGIGCISNAASQPLIIGSHLGTFAIATTGRLIYKAELVDRLFRQRTTHFSEMSGGKINSTELVATLINRQESFVQGIHSAQQAIEGACSMLLLTGQGIIASRDRLGRTPLIIGKKADSHCVGVETCAFPNLGYEPVYELGPGEIVRLTADGFEQLQPPGKQLQICAFLWIYYGYPASTYEGRNVEQVRNRCGACLAKRDTVKPDLVAGIPDSGISHALGYANAANLPYCRPFVKYTPTWPRSFMPQDQTIRNLVARMKLIPIRELIDQKNLLFCDDSIVRGTQLRETISACSATAPARCTCGRPVRRWSFPARFSTCRATARNSIWPPAAPSKSCRDPAAPISPPIPTTPPQTMRPWSTASAQSRPDHAALSAAGGHDQSDRPAARTDLHLLLDRPLMQPARSGQPTDPTP
jgi:amidophosphoribosyltransferase